jgi:hypothetical protein
MCSGDGCYSRGKGIIDHPLKLTLVKLVSVGLYRRHHHQPECHTLQLMENASILITPAVETRDTIDGKCNERPLGLFLNNGIQRAGQQTTS